MGLLSGLAFIGLLATATEAEVFRLRFGGADGLPWAEWTLLDLMVEDTAATLQPLELQPDENVVGQLPYWERSLFRRPVDPLWRDGMPRMWQGTGANSRGLQFQNFLKFIDGDVNTAFVDITMPAGEVFFTLDMGAPIPAERFVVVPPEGVDPGTQTPYRPFWAFEGYALTASNDQSLVNNQEPVFLASYTYLGQVFPIAGFAKSVSPQDVVLAEEEQNFDSIIEVEFPLQYLRFFRFRPYPDGAPDFALGSSPQAGPPLGSGFYTRFAIAEMEVYGRGFVPRARWESRVIDLGAVANIGQAVLKTSKWRKEERGLVAAPRAPAEAKVAVKSGLDDTPRVYYSFDDLGQAVEVSLANYEFLKQRRFTSDPLALGWQGPVVDDVDQWSFWTAPLREGGDRPRVPPGRYAQVQVRFETESLWEYVRLDSLVLEISPLLAERVVGEVAAADALQPEGDLVQLEAGVGTELVCDVGAVFSGTSQGGFYAVRVSTPAEAVFRGLEMGVPLGEVVPDSVVGESAGFVVYLPRRIGQQDDKRLRLRLQTALYSAAGEIAIEVFARSTADFPQQVVGGDVSAEVGSNQLRIVATASSPGGVLAEVRVEPAVCTPQGDGINDRVQINFNLFRILGEAEVEVEVEVEVFNLLGQRVWRAVQRGREAGRHAVVWDGRDRTGLLVGPGLYLVAVGVETDEGRERKLRSVAVVY